MTRRQAWVLLGSGAATATISCGYRVGGKADLVPKSVQTIAIPAFTSASTRYKLVDALPQQIGREFIARTRFRVLDNPGEADAVLNGSINAAQVYPTVLDPSSGIATSVQVLVIVTINLVERTTGKVLYSRPSMAVRHNYSIAVNPHQFFDESGPAFDRVSRDLAHDIVSSIVENF
jgi:hypothetical protein